MPELRSIFDARPSDFGGITARLGFSYQDQVAARVFLEALTSDEIVKVSCETYDDIVVVWEKDGILKVEFIQVKGENPEHLWTIAKLTNRSEALLEKSLRRDRYTEQSWFRIVTSRQLHPDLTVLTKPRNSEYRSTSNPDFQKLLSKIREPLEAVKSEKENGVDYWLMNTRWEVIPEPDIEQLNMFMLHGVLSQIGQPSDPGILQEVYSDLRAFAKDVAERPIEERDRKWVSKAQLIEKINGWIEPLPETKKAEKLRKKLQDGGLDSVCCNAAEDQRRFYLQKRISDRYFTTEDAEEVDQQVLDRLQTLRSSLDSGEITLNGIQFHDRCLREIRAMQLDNTSTYGSALPSYLSGCMYEITARCRHRFIGLQL